MNRLNYCIAMLLVPMSLAGQDSISSFDIQQYDWLVGHWKGDGFGGVSEEIWAPPVENIMMGMYRHHKDGKIVFYEFMLLNKDGLHLKHFHPDLKGWEEKDDFVSFKTKDFQAGNIILSGLTFEQMGNDQMEIRLKMKRGEEVHTEVFEMKRVRN